MQLEAKDFLRIVEKGGKLAFFDTETGGFQADYNKMYVGAIKMYGQEAKVYAIGENACDKGLVKTLKDELEKADAWVTYYGKGFDIPMLNTRLTRWGIPPADLRPHIDMFYQLKYKLKTGRKSQAHLLEFLQDTMTIMGVPQEEKMTVSPNIWADLWTHFDRNIRILKKRCISDVVGLETLYNVTKHLIRDIRH